MSATTDSTKVTGVAIKKYTVALHPERRKKKNRMYVDIKYTYNGEEKIAEKIPANFWETEGSTIHLYVTSDGTAFRKTVTLSPTDLIGILFLIFIFVVVIIGYLTNFLGFSMKKSAPVGIVLNDDFDLIPDEPDKKTDNTLQENLAGESSQNEQLKNSVFEMPSQEKQMSENSPFEKQASPDSIFENPTFELHPEEEYSHLKKDSFTTDETSKPEENHTSGLNFRFKEE